MKTATEIKHFFRDKLGIKGIRVRTGTGKGLWQGAWLKFEDPQTIPLDFRIFCLKMIYPNSPSCWSGNAGNVRSHGIDMHQREWEQALATWKVEGLTEAVSTVN